MASGPGYVCDNDKECCQGDCTEACCQGEFGMITTFTCDRDGDGSFDSCHLCDTNDNEINDVCYQFDTYGDGVLDSCVECDESNEGESCSSGANEGCKICYDGVCMSNSGESCAPNGDPFDFCATCSDEGVCVHHDGYSCEGNECRVCAGGVCTDLPDMENCGPDSSDCAKCIDGGCGYLSEGASCGGTGPSEICKICDWSGACGDNDGAFCGEDNPCAVCMGGSCASYSSGTCGEEGVNVYCKKCEDGQCVNDDGAECAEGCGVCSGGVCDTSTLDGTECGWGGHKECMICQGGACVEDDFAPCDDDGCKICLGGLCTAPPVLEGVSCGAGDDFFCKFCQGGSCVNEGDGAVCGGSPFGLLPPDFSSCRGCEDGECKGAASASEGEICGEGGCLLCDGNGDCAKPVAGGTICGDSCRKCDEFGFCDVNLADGTACNPSGCTTCNDGACSNKQDGGACPNTGGADAECTECEDGECTSWTGLLCWWNSENDCGVCNGESMCVPASPEVCQDYIA